MLLKSLQITKTAVFINEGILVIIAAILCSITDRVPNQTCLWDKLYVNLHLLTGILHLLIWLWDVFGIRQLYCHLSAFFKEPI